MPEYHTLQQAASRMGLSTNAVRALCQNEELPGAFQEHRRGPWRIPVESVNTWIEANIERRRNRRRSITRFISIAGITTAMALIFAFVSGLADWDNAILRLQQSGVLRSYAQAESGETLIIVFDFYTTGNVDDTDIAGEIRRAIRTEAEKNNLDNVRVEIDSRRLKPEEKERATKIGLTNEASIVIWGQDTGVRVTTNFLNIKNPELLLSDQPINETQHSQFADSDGYAVFVTQDLPHQLTNLSLFAIGQSLITEGKFDNAIDVLEACAKGFDQDKSLEGKEYAYQYLGWLYLAEPNYDQALAAFNKVLELDPNNYIAYVNRGILFGAFSKLPESYADFDKAILIDPNNKTAYYNRGLNFGVTGDYERAIADFTQAIIIDPEFDLAFYNRAVAYTFRTNNDKQAIDDFSKAIEINPEFWAAYQGRSALYLITENYEGAVEDTTKIINKYPDLKEPRVNRSRAYLKLGQTESAIDDITKILELEPQNATWYCNRGLIYQTIGDVVNAIKDYESCLNYADSDELRTVAETALSKLIKP